MNKEKYYIICEECGASDSCQEVNWEGYRIIKRKFNLILDDGVKPPRKKMNKEIKQLLAEVMPFFTDCPNCGEKANREGIEKIIEKTYNKARKDLIEEDIKRLEGKGLPYFARMCQNRNGLEYCGTCEQAWEDCSCPARNTGYKKALQEEINYKKNKK
jgi:hypothetical protein